MRDEEAPGPLSDRPQLGLDLTVRRTDYRRSNFVVTAANAGALGLTLAFLESNEPGLAVTGPPGSGKTHLLHILAEAGGGEVIEAAALDGAGGDPGALMIVDNAHNADPKRLLALLETVRARRGRIAIAGSAGPRSWAHGLRDLETRLEAMARVSLDEPDEDLLRAVIVQRFRERQWRAAEGVAEYAAPRIPRTFAAAERFVAAVGAEAIAAGKPISQGLARKILENLFEGASAS